MVSFSDYLPLSSLGMRNKKRKSETFRKNIQLFIISFSFISTFLTLSVSILFEYSQNLSVGFEIRAHMKHGEITKLYAGMKLKMLRVVLMTLVMQKIAKEEPVNQPGT